MAQFSCPICGDSKKNKLKARGFFLQKNVGWSYKCHNCGIRCNLFFFLERFDSQVKQEYVLKKIKASSQQENVVQPTFEKPTFDKKTIHLDSAVCVTKLNVDHPARVYLEKRLIPKQHLKCFYYADCFRTFVTSQDPEKGENLIENEPRIIIPFFDVRGKIFAVQGRSLDADSDMRYITIKFRDHPKIFGLDRIKIKERLYIVEGPIDSLFLTNAIAMAGSDFDARSVFKPETTVFLMDNEPRNPEICDRMEKTIAQGFGICILPETISRRGKDLNDIVLSGVSEKELQTAVDSHCYWGLEATLKFSAWKRSKPLTKWKDRV